VADLLHGSAAEKRLEMRVIFDPGLPETMRGDGQRLGQILTNLVGNAIKFTDEGTIAIEVRDVSDHAGADGGTRALQFSVSDTGIGVAADQAEVIFEKYVQVGDNSRRKHEGTGLGLSICRQLAEMMGGRIWLESTPGEGSTFYVRIPLAEVNQTASGAEWCDQMVAELSGCRVLLVEDHAVNRRLLRLQLESCGMRVDGAPDAAAALHRLRSALPEAPYAAAIIDLALPDMDGVDLARRIRAESELAALPLMLTAPAAGDMEALRGLIFDEVVQKPVVPRLLIRALNSLIRHHRSLQPGGGPAGQADSVPVTAGEVAPSPASGPAKQTGGDSDSAAAIEAAG
jgi:CheY-like chemotaxis protein